MPTLDLKQITNKLNAEFAGDTRKIVFWYDDAAEFVDDIDSKIKPELTGAKLHILKKDTMFQTKYLLERHDVESSYLVYAPFPKPDARNNVLEDMYLYSTPFSTDRATLIVTDLGVSNKLKPVFQKYIKFFAAKDRTQRFYDFEIETFTDETIEIALMSALCKTRTASIDEVLRVVLTDGGFDDNLYLAEFKKYGLLPAFWRICEETFGFNAASPNLTRLAIALFVTYTARQLRGDVPKAWKEFVSYKSGSIIAFLDNLMNSIIYRPQYDKLAAHIASALNVREAMDGVELEAIIDCDVFVVFDKLILNWMTERLLNEDTGASLNGVNIATLCDIRKRKHYGAIFSGRYQMLEAAHNIIKIANYSCSENTKELIERYIKTDYQIDTAYRHFYTVFDRLDDSSDYEDLRILVENIYTNKYLSRLLPAWNTSLDVKTLMHGESSQLRFYNEHIKYAKDKTVVIISDALRYEVARELFAKLDSNPNFTPVMRHMIAAIPTYTALGMAALLPHKLLDIMEDGKVSVDGQPSDDTKKRESILQTALPLSRCVRADNLPIKRDDLREIFTGMDVVYVYHDHIDIRGSSSENEVFNACAEAVNEIYDIVKRLSGSGNVYRFIITTDHGFLYKRDKFAESDKINLSGLKNAFVNRRFLISDKSVVMDGVASALLSDVVGGDDTKIISWPVGVNVFKTHGGLNYVHGGASPQEMILPLITIKTEKGHVETHPAKIALVSMVQKITNLITQLDFIQQEPVCDVVKPAEYKLYFESEENEKISNEHIYKADKKDSDPNKRMFRLRFNFKNKKYNTTKKYWLVAVNTATGVCLFRHQVIMDIAFADDFGFDL